VIGTSKVRTLPAQRLDGADLAEAVHLPKVRQVDGVLTHLLRMGTNTQAAGSKVAVVVVGKFGDGPAGAADALAPILLVISEDEAIALDARPRA
jgi:hypothetical protein